MDVLESDLQQLEDAMRTVFQAMKRPQNWARISARAGLNIDRPSAVILYKLSAAPAKSLRVQDLADQLGIEAPSVTRKTQALEQAGYLERRPDPRDRRAISLQLTGEGRNVSRRLWKAQREVIAQALATWKPSERHKFITLFERFATDLATITKFK